LNVHVYLRILDDITFSAIVYTRRVTCVYLAECPRNSLQCQPVGKWKQCQTEALITVQMIPSGTNSQPAEVSYHW